MRGEIDGCATGPDTILQRNRDWLDKGLANIHAIMETPKGDKHPHPFFAKLPEIETFAKNDRERKMLPCTRGFPRHRHAIRAAARNTEGSGRYIEGRFPQDLSRIRISPKSIGNSHPTIRRLCCRKITRRRSEKSRATRKRSSCLK